MIRNLNTRSGDYAKTADLLRPGHADYTAYAKYEAFRMHAAAGISLAALRRPAWQRARSVRPC